MSLTKGGGVNLEKLERRLKIDVKKDEKSLFFYHRSRCWKMFI